MKITRKELRRIVKEELVNEIALEKEGEPEKQVIQELYEMALRFAGNKGLEEEEARIEAARLLAMAQNKTWKHPAAPEVDVEDVMYREKD